MALSGYSVASVVSLNRRAWTQSLKRETTRSALSAVGPSMMSQPVSIASAPRLVAPRRNSRRDGSGNSLAASLIRSFGSTPGGGFRGRATTFFSSPAEDHRAQAFRHDQCEHNMDGQKHDDSGHREKVHITRDVIAAEKNGQV